MMNMGPGLGGAQSITDQMTPTFQASLTWVKDNHTFKFGSEMRLFGYPLHSLAAANGSFVFAANQTALPYAQSAAKRWDSPTRLADRKAFHRFLRSGFLEGHP
jgi:hypothetical protein